MATETAFFFFMAYFHVVCDGLRYRKTWSQGIGYFNGCAGQEVDFVPAALKGGTCCPWPPALFMLFRFSLL